MLSVTLTVSMFCGIYKTYVRHSGGINRNLNPAFDGHYFKKKMLVSFSNFQHFYLVPDDHNLTQSEAGKNKPAVLNNYVNIFSF